MSSETGALRFNTTKYQPALVPASLVRYCAYGMTYGAVKYAPNNWRKGFDWTSIINSLERHLLAFKEGEDIDEESGLPHLALMACNLGFLIEHFDVGLGKDDRFQYPHPPQGQMHYQFRRRELSFKTPPKREEVDAKLQ